jgi:ABC-type sugar transport system permease subunit
MICVMDEAFMGTKHGINGRLSLSLYRYRPVMAALLLPSLLLIGVFSYYPAVRSLIGGFYQWNGFSPPVYAGLSQFRQYLRSPDFGIEVKNIAVLTGGAILISLVSQFTAAEIVTRMPPRAAAIAKYVLVLPIVLPPLVLIEVWAYLLQPGSGLVDHILGSAGLPQPSWFSDTHLALASILLVGFPWISNLGFLIFLGGLQNLPRDILDAARLDGVGVLRRVFAIDIPLLMPQFRIVVILSGINAVQNFVPILLLTNGGPGTASLVPGLDMYQSAFSNDQYGYGMAIGTLLFVAMLIFTLAAMRILRTRTT